MNLASLILAFSLGSATVFCGGIERRVITRSEFREMAESILDALEDPPSETSSNAPSEPKEYDESNFEFLDPDEIENIPLVTVFSSEEEYQLSKSSKKANVPASSHNIGF